MGGRNFLDLLEVQWSRGNLVCVGLDSAFEKIPRSAYKGGNEDQVSIANTIVEFNTAIVKATKDLVCAYKLNSAFYEKYGLEGLEALHRTIAMIHVLAPDVLVILDAKRGDIGNTNEGYVGAAFSFLHADAITLHPYLGAESLEPFLEMEDKGLFVLCRTSNLGAGEFQDLIVDGGEPLYLFVARRVANEWNTNGNCALVVGATYPEELRQVRELVGDMPILIPGIGAQGGDVESTVLAGRNSAGGGMVINSSRGIIFASDGQDFAQAARYETRKLRDMINRFR